MTQTEGPARKKDGGSEGSDGGEGAGEGEGLDGGEGAGEGEGSEEGGGEGGGEGGAAVAVVEAAWAAVTERRLRGRQRLR